MKFRQKELKKYDWLIKYIRDEVKTGRNFWASLFSGGLTFISDIERFCNYASQVGALDISEEIIKEHPEFISPINPNNP